MRRVVFGAVLLALSPVVASWASESWEVGLLVGVGWIGWLLMLAGKREVTAGLVGPREQAFDPPETSLPRNVWSVEQLSEMGPEGWALEPELSVPPPRVAVPSARARHSAWLGLVLCATAAFLILVPLVTSVGATSVFTWMVVIICVLIGSNGNWPAEWTRFEAHKDTVTLMGAAPAVATESWISEPGNEGPSTEAWRFKYATPELGETSVVIESDEGTYAAGQELTLLYLPFPAPWPPAGESAVAYEKAAARATDTSGRLYRKFIEPGSGERRILRPPMPQGPAFRGGSAVVTGLLVAMVVLGLGHVLGVNRDDHGLIMAHAWIVAGGGLAWWTRGWLEDQMAWRAKKAMAGQGRPIQAVVVYSDFEEGLGGLAVFQYVIERKLYTVCERHFDGELRSGARRIALYDPKAPWEAMLTGVETYRLGGGREPEKLGLRPAG